MVGASPNWNRPSYFVMRYLQRKGYRVIPVNPRALDAPILGETVYPDLDSIPVPVDVVDVFRRPEDVPEIANAAARIGAQGPVAPARHPEPRGAAIAGLAGLTFIEDRCMKIEYGRLSGELAWSGINTRTPLEPTRAAARMTDDRRDEADGRRSRSTRPTASRRGPSTPARSPDPVTGSRNVPIHQTTAYVFDDVDHAAALFNLQTFGYIYSRITNPTVAALEERVAALEGGRAAVAAASGHAAQLLAFYTLLEPGDHVVAARQLYGGSLTQLATRSRASAGRATFVDATDPSAVAARDRRADEGRLRRVARQPGRRRRRHRGTGHDRARRVIPLIVDNTLATPYLCRPFEWGADLVVHSLTKFLSGHGTSMGGIVVESGRFDWEASGKFPFLTGPDPAYHGLDFIETFGDFGFSMKARAVALRDLGPALSPTNAFHILTGTRRCRCGWSATSRTPGASPSSSTAIRRWPGCRTPACRRARPMRWPPATCRSGRVRCSRSASAAASRRASGSSRASTCGRTWPTSATRGA